jgi:NitT/TauT family transport system substrate-binding protein
VSELGQRAGIFKKHGLTLDIVYTQGSGETQQAVISGSVDIGVAIGTMGALGAYAKGAPVRVIGQLIAGAGDLYWYVRAASPIHKITDIDGHTIAFSTKGSSTDGVVTAYIQQYKLKARPVATGSPPSTLTQVMSGQVDVGWSLPPFGLAQLDAGTLRQIATGNDAHVFRGQTVRLLITTAPTLEAKRDAITRYMRAYRETLDWMFAGDDALKPFADFAGTTEPLAKRTRGYFTREAMSPDRVIGLDVIMPDAIAMKFIAAPLTEAQLRELIQIPKQ